MGEYYYELNVLFKSCRFIPTFFWVIIVFILFLMTLPFLYLNGTVRVLAAFVR